MPERRRVTLFDVMTVIAATAVGLWLSRFAWPLNAPSLKSWTTLSKIGPGYPSERWMLPIAERVVLLLPCLAAWSGAIVLIRLQAPRPRWRRLVLQPGWMAAIAVISVLTVESTILIASAKIDGRFGWSTPSRLIEFATNAIVLLAHHAGWAVAICWLTLALAGRRRAEASWIDRCGRLLGWAWILIAPLASILIDHGAWWGQFISQ